MTNRFQAVVLGGSTTTNIPPTWMRAWPLSMKGWKSTILSAYNIPLTGVRSRQAYQLQLGLDWYDSRSEFAALLKAVKDKAEPDMTEQRMRRLADELIKELGAYPDNSIIDAYQTRPTLGKLPDYIVAQAIEQAIILKKHTRQ